MKGFKKLKGEKKMKRISFLDLKKSKDGEILKGVGEKIEEGWEVFHKEQREKVLIESKRIKNKVESVSCMIEKMNGEVSRPSWSDLRQINTELDILIKGLFNERVKYELKEGESNG